jgi:hypothetical protein
MITMAHAFIDEHRGRVKVRKDSKVIPAQSEKTTLT